METDIEQNSYKNMTLEESKDLPILKSLGRRSEAWLRLITVSRWSIRAESLRKQSNNWSTLLNNWNHLDTLLRRCSSNMNMRVRLYKSWLVRSKGWSCSSRKRKQSWNRSMKWKYSNWKIWLSKCKRGLFSWRTLDTNHKRSLCSKSCKEDRAGKFSTCKTT